MQNKPKWKKKVNITENISFECFFFHLTYQNAKTSCKTPFTDKQNNIDKNEYFEYF